MHSGPGFEVLQAWAWRREGSETSRRLPPAAHQGAAPEGTGAACATLEGSTRHVASEEPVNDGQPGARQDAPGSPQKPLMAFGTRGEHLTPEHALARLLGQPRWCCWVWHPIARRKQGDVVWTKKPLRPAKAGPGWPLSVNKAVDHGRGYELAADAVKRGDADGVGWLLQDELQLVWLDLDKCRDPRTGAIAAWAQALIDWVPGAYVEMTPSGTGIRIAGQARMDFPLQGTLRIKAFLAGLGEDGLALWGGSREADDRAQVEIYFACSRFVTVTGLQVGTGCLDVDLGLLALTLWQNAQRQPGATRGRGPAKALANEDKTAPIEDVVSALGVIPNDAVSWDDWSRVGMAAWAATRGSADGFDAWAQWSARCELKHDPGSCEERWSHWHTSPPTQLGFGTLAKLAGEATNRQWRRPSRAPTAEFDVEPGGENDDAQEGERADAGGTAGDRARKSGGIPDAGGGGAGGEVGTPFERLAARIVYVLKVDRFYDEVTRELLNREQLCAIAGELGVPGHATKGAKGVVAQLTGHPAGLMRRAVRLTMRPGKGRLVVEGGFVACNLWNPSSLQPSDADPTVWLEHIERLIPNAADRDRVLNRMAYGLQHPGVKINSALVLMGPQGAGKDTILQPFLRGVGDRNVGVVPGHAVGGQFNAYLQNPWLLITEMPPARKRSCYEEIKSWLTTPPDEIMVNPKGIEMFQIPNIVNAVVTTNHAGAIALAPDDRRFDVVETIPAGGEHAEAYFKMIYGWLAAGGDEAVMGYLLRRDCSAFNPKGAPPRTEAKLAMMKEGAGIAVAWACSLWEEGGVLAGRELITAQEVMGYAQHVQFGAGDPVRRSVVMESVTAALELSGWRRIETRVPDGPARPRPWTRGTAFELLSQLDPKDLQARLEEDRKRHSTNGNGDAWER